jgi:TP901 family phage tail tape measure protein
MALNKKVAIEVEIKNIEKVSKLKKELQELRKQQKATEKATADGVKLGKKTARQYSETATAIKNKSSELRGLNKSLRDSNDSTKKTTKSSNGMAKQFVKGAAAIGVVVTAFRTINRAVSAVITTFSEFEFVMAKVNAVSGATEQEFKQLEQSAQDLGRTTFFTAAQVGELQLNFSKLGFTAEEIMNAQQATLNLATATGSDLARSATVAGAAIRGFGLDASETERVVDVMAVAFASSAMDIEKFQTSMTKVAPIAKASGFSLEDTTAIMSKLTDSGIEASIAGTSLRNILLKMQDPSSDLTKAFGKTIHGLDDLVPAMKAFVKEGGSMADVMEVVDLRQAAAFEQMLSTSDSTLELRDSLLQANGEGERMANIVGDTLQGAFLKFKSAIQGFSIVLLEKISKPFQAMIESSANLFNKLTLLAEGFSSMNEKIFASAKAFKAEKEATEQLVTEYAKLDGIVNKTKEEKIRFSLITEQLEANIGDSIKIIDQETGALILNSKALDASIARHALLADGEAVKLVHQLNKVKKEVGENTKALGNNNKTIQVNQDLLDELSMTEADRYVNTQQSTNAVKMLNAENQVQENVVSKVIKKTQEQIDLEAKINKMQQTNIPLKNKNIELNEEEALILSQLNELGYTQEDILNLTKTSLSDMTDELNKNTTSTKANVDAKKQLNDVERILLEYKKSLMDEGLLSEIEAAQVRKDLIRQQIADLKELLKTDKDVEKNKTEIAQKIFDLEKKLNKDNQKDKDEAFKADVKRAILSGQTAEEAMKSVVRAQIMEAVAGFIASVFKNVPFPLNLVLAAGASAVVGKVIDEQINRFEKGGVVEAYANGGMVQGKSHAQGGEKFSVGGRVVELEGGEAVINKRSTSMFKGQLSAMNAAGGGVKFADGGLMNMPSFASSQFNATSQQNMMGAMNQSSRVVVVEADITNSQNTVGLIEAEATF